MLICDHRISQYHKQSITVNYESNKTESTQIVQTSIKADSKHDDDDDNYAMHLLANRQHHAVHNALLSTGK